MSDDPSATVGLETPNDIIASIPFLLGFHPQQEALVTVGLCNTHVVLVSHCDLPPPGGQPADSIRVLLPALEQRQVSEAIVVAYATPELATPAVNAATILLERTGIRMREALRVTGRRYWSYVSATPPEGAVYEPDASTAPASLVTAGEVALPTRDAFAAAIAPVTGTRRQAMRQAVQEVERHHGPRWGGARSPRFTAEAVTAMRALADRVDNGDPGPTTPEDIAEVLVRLRSTSAVDVIGNRIHPENREAHLELWLRVTRHAEPRYRAAPASLAALTAWQAGRGALAKLAVTAAIEDQPSHPIALALKELLTKGVPPSAWRRIQ